MCTSRLNCRPFTDQLATPTTPAARFQHPTTRATTPSDLTTTDKLMSCREYLRKIYNKKVGHVSASQFAAVYHIASLGSPDWL